MIERLNHQEEAVAAEILALQIPGYQVEASWVGFDGVPQLNDTVQMIINSGETFFGFLSGGELAGFLSYKEEKGAAFIHRLVVHPGHFHEGIASKMIKCFIEEEANGREVQVTTGKKNNAARKLYTKFGFREVEEYSTDSGADIVLMEKVQKEVQ
jgi:ribosomal protein S18 acetylase RimI-like enzyme